LARGRKVDAGGLMVTGPVAFAPSKTRNQ